MELGYTSAFDVLDASRFGVPQSRRRVVIIGIQNCAMSSEDLKTTFEDMISKATASVRQHWGLHQTKIVSAKEAIDDLTGGVRVTCPDSEKI